MKTKAEENATKPHKHSKKNCTEQLQSDRKVFVQVCCNRRQRLNTTLVKVKEGTFLSTAGEGDWSYASSPALFANWCFEVRLLTPIDWEIRVLSFLMIAVESGSFRYSRKASLVVKLARG